MQGGSCSVGKPCRCLAHAGRGHWGTSQGQGSWSRAQRKDLLAGLGVVQHEGLLLTTVKKPELPGSQQCHGMMEHPGQLSWQVLAGSGVHLWEQGRVCCVGTAAVCSFTSPGDIPA